MKLQLGNNFHLKQKFILLCFVLFVGAFTSCVNVKPFQKQYLNDEEMKLSARRLEMFENSAETYREGASGATGGKTGGGCGCN